MGIEIIVAHDTQPGCAPDYNWGDVFNSFQHCKVDDRNKPHTTAVSNTIPLCDFTL